MIIENVPFASMLPRGLIKLDSHLNFVLPSSELYEAAWIDAPPQLEYVWRISASLVLPSETSWIPESLQIGECFVEASSPQFFEIPTNFLSISHHSLVAVFSTLVWTARLPQNLTYLSLSGGTSLPLSHLHCLPSTLNCLRVVIEWSNQDLKDAMKLDLATLWPPALTDLELEARDFDVFMAVLPPTLEVLGMPEQPFEHAVYLRTLPPLLRTLSVIGDLRLIDHLPLNLKSLSFTYSTLYKLWPTLPSSLTELSGYQRFNSWRIDISTAANLLPAPITTLLLAEWQMDWFHFLPRTVTDLAIHKLISGSKHYNEPDRFRELPKSLIKLKLLGGSYAKLSSTSLAHLGNLIYLEMSLIGFPSAAIVHLPRTMKSLQTSLGRLNPSDLQFLPRTLTRCNLGLKETDADLYYYWPSAIARLLPTNVRLSPRWKSFL